MGYEIDPPKSGILVSFCFVANIFLIRDMTVCAADSSRIDGYRSSCQRTKKIKQFWAGF